MNRLFKYWILLLVAASAIIIRIPAFFLPMNRDSGTFAYGGWRILAGALPYTGFWDNKPPGVFYINALAIRIFGATPTGLVIFQMLYGIASALVFYAVARRLFSSRTALITSLLFVFYHGSYGLAEEGNFTECYLALPVLFSVLLILRWSAGKHRSLVIPALAGSIGVLAGLIKQPGAAVIPAVALFALASDRKTGWKSAAAVIVGAAAVFLAVVGWMVSKGMLAGAIEANVTFNRLYSSDAYTNNFSTALWNLYRGLAISALPLAGAAAGIIVSRKKKLPFKNANILLILWFILDLVGVVTGGRFYTHYFLAVLPSALLLTGVFLDSISSRRSAIAAALVGFVLILGPVWSVKGSLPERKMFPVSSAIEREYYAVRWVIVRRLGQGVQLPAEEIAEWVKDNTIDTETIYAWGYDPRIGFLSQRAFPSRYIHLHPLAASGFNREERIRELARDIERKLPAYIIDESSVPQLRTTAPPLDRRVPLPASPYQQLFRLDGYGPVQKVVAEHYRPVNIVGGCLIYGLK